jgi:uncharacterized membrane protein
VVNSWRDVNRLADASLTHPFVTPHVFPRMFLLINAFPRSSRRGVKWYGKSTLPDVNSSAGLYVKTYLSISFMVLFGPLGNVLLGKGMKQIGAMSLGTPARALEFLSHVLTSGTIWLGIGALLTFFLAYMLVLSWADYSYVQPASAVANGMSALLAHFMLHETITPTRWVGVLVICVGVLLVGQTPLRTTEPR